MFQESLKGISRISRMFQEILRVFEGVSRRFQRCFNEVLMLFHGCLMVMSCMIQGCCLVRLFQSCFKPVYWAVQAI